MSYKRSDFPKGEPVLKEKRGLWYRPNNCGYTSSVLTAGLYEREAALDYCFGVKGRTNGHFDVYAVPLRRALQGTDWTKERLADLVAHIQTNLMPFAETEAERKERQDKWHTAKTAP